MSNPLQDLKDSLSKGLYGMTSTEAREKGVCVQCKKKVVTGVNVFTEAGHREYHISGLCEVCFDSITS